MNLKISIIVPVYKVELYIRECIDSILSQTFTDFELILINDGSPDNCGEICEEYGRRDKRVQVIHRQNGGPSSARNLGINVAKGDYLAFVDSDDTIESNMYEKMYALGLEQEADIIACGYFEINHFSNETLKLISPLGSKSIIKGKQIKEDLEALLLENKILGFASMCNKLYKRSFIIENNILINEGIKIAEDLCFNLIALSNANKICGINEPFYRYRRINPESLMNKKTGAFESHLRARNEILNVLKSIKVKEEVYTKCLKIENGKTVSDYLNQIISVLKSDIKIINKFQKFIQFTLERDFIIAIKNYDNNILGLKARILVIIIKCFLSMKKLVRIKKYNIKI
ncbi:hypothetical protein COJ96_10165 [Bacillus sp. AFS073361]|uniref:glycosyltransferase n=1 Tax=Bacillus sp. AFS073361 TaxID=2033511 RepID=UPI000BF28FA8|nr:glycosyltransferase [Bacillus sp. AFS073361]PFP29503.1 hypothetical protein COJ96_10165 [Bacillus sp. AFS073361]